MESATLKHQIAARILELKREDENDAEFARRIGLSPQVINNYRSGRFGASVDVVYAVARKAGVTADSLLGLQPATLQPATLHEIAELERMLSGAVKSVRKIRQRYEPTLLPGGVDVNELVDVIRRLEGAARDELLRRAAEPPPQAQAG